jgi:hypothetical protein
MRAAHAAAGGVCARDGLAAAGLHGPRTVAPPPLPPPHPPKNPSRPQERSDLLSNAPHLAHPLPILMPCYKFWEVPFYWAGLKMYDVVAGGAAGPGAAQGAHLHRDAGVPTRQHAVALGADGPPAAPPPRRAGMRNLGWSKYLTPSESLRQLPTLADPNPRGKSLKGTVRRAPGEAGLQVG